MFSHFKSSIINYKRYFLNLMALHLAYSWAKSLFEQSPISPQRDCYDNGEECELCHYKVLPSNSIVVCKCDKYSHYHCLINKFSSVTLKTRKEARCQKCQQIIKIAYQEKKVLKPKIEFCLLVELLLALALLFQCTYVLIISFMQVQNTMENIQNEQMVKIGVAIVGVILSTIWISIIFKKIIWKNEISIKEIYPVRMEIKIDHFDEGLKTQPASVQAIHNDDNFDERFDNIEIR